MYRGKYSNCMITDVVPWLVTFDQSGCNIGGE